MKTKTQMKKVKAAAVFLFAVMLAACLPQTAVQAAELHSYTVTGTYKQTDAREMLVMINNFRTGTEAWQWNETNTEKVPVSGLQQLQYDYQLERIAMQRAMELVVSYSHTRPNGESCFTAYSGGYHSMGENIAIGTGDMTASYVFQLWKEDNEGYAGQGHRRNMLDSRYGAVGISHVYYNGCHYWVQEFADSVQSAVYTNPNNESTAVEMQIRSDLITSLTYTAYPSSYQMKSGESRPLPTVSAELRTKDTWRSAPPALVQPTDACVWTVRDASHAFITGNQLSALQSGRTSLTATIGGKTIEVPVTVNGSSTNLGAAVIRLSQTSYVYDGYAKTPAVTVMLNGAILKENTDYFVMYFNNTAPGTAQVTVTGIGAYSGSAYASFTITNQQQTSFDLSRAIVTLAQNSYVYDGYAKTPAVTVTLNGYTLRQNIDYTVSYSNNIYAGTAQVTVTGIGAYSGSTYASFTITNQQQTSFDLSRAIVTLAQNSYVYDGYAKTPAVTVTLNGYTLRQNIDYTVTYSNNIYAGTAQVTVTGIGAYSGSTYASFTITNQQQTSFDLSRAVVTLAQNSYVYDGYAKTPAVTVTLNGYTLKQNTDYTVMYSNNTHEGTARVTVFGINRYTGMASASFTIANPVTDLAPAIVTLETDSYVYDGYDKTPSVMVILNGYILKENSDYTVTYTKNTNAGTAHVAITGINKYSGSITRDFTIQKANNKVTLKQANYYLIYNGKPRTIALNVKRAAGTVKYSSNRPKVKANAAGKVTVAGNFTGKAVITVKVTDKNYKTVTKKVNIYVYR